MEDACKSMGRRLCGCLSHGMRQLICARRGMFFAGRVLPITCFVFKLLWFRDTDDD